MTQQYISDEIRENVRLAFHNRCAYCQSSQQYILGVLEIDHIIPIAQAGSNDELNLCLACRLCNAYKSSQIEAIDPQTNISITIFNPRTQIWKEHFQWSEDGLYINGLSSCGRASVDALKLNNPIALTVRANWIIAGWHPPKL